MKNTVINMYFQKLKRLKNVGGNFILLESELFPLKEGKFNNLNIKIPNKSISYLSKDMVIVLKKMLEDT